MSESGYFAVIPGGLLHASDVSDGAKLFYCEVSRRCNERGYCWASNEALAGDLNCGERTISRYVSELEDTGAIFTEDVGVSDRKRRHERRIRLAETCGFNIAKNGDVNVAKNGELNVAKNGEVNNRLNNISKNNPPIAPQGGERDLMFDRFWALYPRKANKKAARRAWDKLKPDLLLCSQMSVALKAQMRSEQWTRDGGQYIPYPSTWINGRRWEDEAPSAAPQRSRATSRREEDECLN